MRLPAGAIATLATALTNLLLSVNAIHANATQMNFHFANANAVIVLADQTKVSLAHAIPADVAISKTQNIRKESFLITWSNFRSEILLTLPVRVESLILVSALLQVRFRMVRRPPRLPKINS